jgi:hypothetical protein
VASTGYLGTLRLWFESRNSGSRIFRNICFEGWILNVASKGRKNIVVKVDVEIYSKKRSKAIPVTGHGGLAYRIARCR